MPSQKRPEHPKQSPSTKRICAPAALEAKISSHIDRDPVGRTALHNALDLLLDAIVVVDGDGCFVAVSAACEQVFGYTQEEMIGKPFIDLVLPEDRERTLQAAAAVKTGAELRNFENRYIRKDGKVVDIMWSARWSEADQLRLAVAREITDRKRAESRQAALYAISEAAHSAKNLNDLLGSIHKIIGTLLPTPNFCVALYDEASDEISFPYVVDEYDPLPAPGKLDPRTPLGRVIRSGQGLLLTPESEALPAPAGSDAAIVDWLGIPLVAGQQIIGALTVRSYTPALRYHEEHKTLLQFVSNQIAANIERARSQARLQFMAQYDVLTGLPNRSLFDDRLLVALSRAARNKERVALLYIDLDNFKPVNDSYGHAAGDMLLQELAQRIQSCVRESDTVSRIGGDEFIVLLNAQQTEENALRVADHIRAAINRPFNLPRRSLQISASIGAAVYPNHGDDPNQLIRNADVAMYQAKHAGGNRSQLFVPEHE